MTLITSAPPGPLTPWPMDFENKCFQQQAIQAPGVIGDQDDGLAGNLGKELPPPEEEQGQGCLGSFLAGFCDSKQHSPSQLEATFLLCPSLFFLILRNGSRSQVTWQAEVLHKTHYCKDWGCLRVIRVLVLFGRKNEGRWGFNLKLNIYKF